VALVKTDIPLVTSRTTSDPRRENSSGMSIVTVFSIISRQPISEQLDTVWAGIQQRGWVNIEATHSLESLLNTGGSQWFVTNLVKVSSMLFSAYHVT
jgi:hypothetical protein